MSLQQLDLADLTRHPERYAWFDFRPNVKKLILAGAAETEHIAILWYPAADGGVGMHTHAQTEAVYVIDGTQTDAHGSYPTGTAYFNPPGSSHQITHSTGFFLLAYAAAPDFERGGAAQRYAPLRVSLAASHLAQYAFEQQAQGVRTHTLPLAADGGMRAQLIELTPGAEHTHHGHYVLVLSGSCTIDGRAHAAKQLAVSDATEPHAFALSAAAGDVCFMLGMAFRGVARG